MITMSIEHIQIIARQRFDATLMTYLNDVYYLQLIIRIHNVKS